MTRLFVVTPYAQLTLWCEDRFLVHLESLARAAQRHPAAV